MCKRICFIAQFPPPIHGLSKAVETLYDSLDKTEFTKEKVNITNNKLFIRNIIKVIGSNADVFYITLSQSKGGNIRDLLFLWLILLKKRKVVVHLHGGYYRILVDEILPLWQRKINYRLIRKVDATIVLSESLKPIFRGMIDENKIFVVPNCVDDEFVATINEKVGRTDDRRHILYLSNFIKSKGYMEVLKLALIEKRRCEGNFYFDFAGNFTSKKDYEEFNSFIVSQGLEDLVYYYGVVSGDKKRELLQKGDIFILPTRYPKEGQPISILEAMANGLTIVTTDHAAIPDMIQDGINGIIMRKGIPLDKIYEKMLSIDYKVFSANNMKEVERKYTQKLYVKNMGDIFSSLIEK